MVRELVHPSFGAQLLTWGDPLATKKKNNKKKKNPNRPKPLEDGAKAVDPALNGDQHEDDDQSEEPDTPVVVSAVPSMPMRTPLNSNTAHRRHK